MARKLTHQQRRRIQENQQKRIRSYEEDERSDIPVIASRVITNFGKTIIAETDEGELIRCNPRQNLEQIVCGDNVLVQKINNEEAVVSAIQERESLLKKPGFGGKLKPMAANINQVVIVTSVQPEPNPYLIDRYLVAAENLNTHAIIVLNKCDLAENSNILTSLKSEYEKLGYPVLETSINKPDSMLQLKQALDHKISILVGLSGVGKSSLINTLLPDLDIRTGEVSSASGEGTHTTTGSMLYHLPGGGDIIDSPGVRDFGLWNISADDVLYGFVELRPLQGLCRFSNCQHESEPECAINDALEKGKISEQRFQHYKKIIQEYT